MAGTYLRETIDLYRKKTRLETENGHHFVNRRRFTVLKADTMNLSCQLSRIVSFGNEKIWFYNLISTSSFGLRIISLNLQNHPIVVKDMCIISCADNRTALSVYEYSWYKWKGE